MNIFKHRHKNVIPGFGLSFGITITLLSLIVIIPLCTLVIYSSHLSWNDFIDTISRPRVLASYKVSFLTSLIASVINTGLGLLLAWGLVRYNFPWKRFLDGLIELPFALPTAVAGISLTHLSVEQGWIGRFFGFFHIRVAYTRFGIVLALIFIGIPFVVRSVQPVLEKLDSELEDAADMMGASRFQTFVHVILPEITPAVIGGFTMAFARSLGEYGSVVFIAGNTPYETEITPLLIMSELQEYDYPSATSIALVMLLAALLILFINSIIQSRASKIVNGIQ